MSLHAPTLEQKAIIDGAVEMVSGVAHDNGAIKALAAAGSGKTSTLIQIGGAIRDVYPRAQILYLAYNREIMLEASTKFGDSVRTATMHSMALQAVTGRNGRKLGNIYSHHIRDIVGRHLSDSDVDIIMAGMRAFTQSPDNWPNINHMPARISGVGITSERREKLLGSLEELLFAVMPGNPSKTSNELPLPHDIYLKYWQMIGSPGLEQFDLVMLDEAQDANPVILAALEGAGRSIYVGDSHQAIYQWRNAVDALEQVYGHGFPMSQSFRFGPVIAEVANTILSYKHDQPTHPLRGFDMLSSYLGDVDRRRPHARIFRTNRALIREALLLHDRGIDFAIAGNNKEVRDMIASVWALKRGDYREVRHPWVRTLKTWDAAQAQAEKGGDSRDLDQAIKIVDEFEGRVQEILHILMQNDESKATVILTTAHRSKGREWDNVVIASDFDPVLERAKTSKRTWDPEMNLLYVAATRAMECLDVQCDWLRSILRLPASRSM